MRRGAVASPYVTAMECERDAIAVPRATTFRSPRDAFRFFGGLLGDRPIECVVTAHLDADFRVLRVERTAEGDASAATLPVAALLRNALCGGATRLLVAHNHPCGNAAPSTQDKAATRRLATAAAALDLDFLDHVIVARGGSAFSFRLHGLL